MIGVGGGAGVLDIVRVGVVGHEGSDDSLSCDVAMCDAARRVIVSRRVSRRVVLLPEGCVLLDEQLVLRCMPSS